MTADDPAAAARAHLLEEHADALETVLGAADAVAAGWSPLADGRPATADRDAVVEELRGALDRAGVLETLTELLVAAVDAAGYALPATPVPAPPYVAVTTTGPVLRGTVDGGRLVVRIDCFEIVRQPDGVDASVAYAHRGVSPDAALSVSFVASK